MWVPVPYLEGDLKECQLAVGEVRQRRQKIIKGTLLSSKWATGASYSRGTLGDGTELPLLIPPKVQGSWGTYSPILISVWGLLLGVTPVAPPAALGTDWGKPRTASCSRVLLTCTGTVNTDGKCTGHLQHLIQMQKLPVHLSQMRWFNLFLYFVWVRFDW